MLFLGFVMFSIYLTTAWMGCIPALSGFWDVEPNTKNKQVTMFYIIVTGMFSREHQEPQHVCPSNRLDAAKSP